MSSIFIQENVFERVVWKTTAILCRPQCVNGLTQRICCVWRYSLSHTVCTYPLHCSDVIMSAIASKITGAPIVFSTACSGAHQRNIKSLRRWPLWGKPLVTYGLPSQRASNAENVSIWWRHRVHLLCYAHTIGSQCIHVTICPYSTKL